jgi:hypothetical protein
MYNVRSVRKEAPRGKWAFFFVLGTQSSDWYRTRTELVQHSADRWSSHRRNGATSHILKMVGLNFLSFHLKAVPHIWIYNWPPSVITYFKKCTRRCKRALKFKKVYEHTRARKKVSRLSPYAFKIQDRQLIYYIFSQRIIIFYILTVYTSKADFSLFSGSQLNFSSVLRKVRIIAGFTHTQRWASTLTSRSNARHRSNARPSIERSERSYFSEKPKAKIMPSTMIVDDHNV